MRKVWTLLGTALLVGLAVVAAPRIVERLELDPSLDVDDPVAFDPMPGERIRIEVLNAGGRTGMARIATDRLRERGFDVVYLGNAASFDESPSRVLARSGRLDFARVVGDALGIEAVADEPDTALYLDVTVRLGGDWDPPVDTMVASGEPPVPWWDVRAWWRELRSPEP